MPILKFVFLTTKHFIKISWKSTIFLIFCISSFLYPRSTQIDNYLIRHDPIMVKGKSLIVLEHVESSKIFLTEFNKNEVKNDRIVHRTKYTPMWLFTWRSVSSIFILTFTLLIIFSESSFLYDSICYASFKMIVMKNNDGIIYYTLFDRVIFSSIKLKSKSDIQYDIQYLSPNKGVINWLRSFSKKEKFYTLQEIRNSSLQKIGIL